MSKDASKVTIYDISKKLEISAATVSRALNNNPRISIKTKALVVKTAREMNYSQNRLALALKSGKTNTVGVIVPFIDRNFFSSVIRGIEEELSPLGYHVIICQSHDDSKNEINQLNTLLNAQVDGIFMSIAKNTTRTEHIEGALAKKIPLLFFDRKKDIEGISSVTLDDFRGGYLATEHLIDQGCKKIAHFSGNFNLEIYKNRHDGYAAALKKYNIPYRKELIIQVSSKTNKGASAMAKLWQLEDRPDALFSSSDYCALGAIQQLKKMKVAIPGTFCVAGFSNAPFTKYMELPVTSVDQTPVKMGKVCATVFLEQLQDGTTKTLEKRVILEPKLHIRESSNRKL